jgi:hypothetical protein
MLGQTGAKLFILAWYKTNQQYIATTLCVKKNDTGSHCKGSCHLRKQLQQEEKRQQHAPEWMKDVQMVQAPSVVKLSWIPEEVSTVNFSFTTRKPISVSYIPFHPPTV